SNIYTCPKRHEEGIYNDAEREGVQQQSQGTNKTCGWLLAGEKGLKTGDILRLYAEVASKLPPTK
ncbi:hypothetical protein, partial [Pseudomonas amygdali]|uniref:hypothetical protein n=1 Tax=Pseudomonas amygdali TaxID=47877 RepID=UPI001CA4BED8